LEEIGLTIDGKTVRCPPGTSLWNAALQSGIKIPSLCNHPELKPAGACRICLVEDAGSGRILASCVTPASQGMNIETHSPEVLGHRANIIRLIMANHPESCILCDQGNRCVLRDVAADLGVGRIDLYPMNRYHPLEDANPFIVRDLTKCILCGRCIRADRELVVVGAIDVHHRGIEARPSTLHGRPLEESSCTFCGTCVSMCPTGALRTRTRGYAGSPEKWSESVCGFCGVGCSLSLGSSAGRIVEVEPSQGEGSVNRATLCVRGHFENDFLGSMDRLTSPALTRDGKRREVDWEEALDHTSRELRRIRDEYGPQSIAFWGSTRCTLEENYLFQKIARALLGTGNVLSGREPGPREAALRNRGIRSLDELEGAEALLVAGCNPTDSSPVLGYALKRAARLGGKPIVVMDPIRTDLAGFAAAWVPVPLQRDAEVLKALSSLLYRGGLRSEVVPEGGSKFLEEIHQLDVGALCAAHNLDEPLIARAAEALEGRKIAFVVGDGILTQPRAESVLEAFGNLALLSGSLSAPSGGFFFPSSTSNHEGALDMGASPGLLPGRLAVENSENRKHWERFWGVRLSPDAGLSPGRAVEEMKRGNLKALYVMGENPIRNLPGPSQTSAAFARLELLVVQDILATRTAASAHVLLPGAAFSEKEGGFTNMEGRIQLFEPAVPPPEGARPDWRILLDLYERLAPSGGTYGGIEDVRLEIRNHVPGYEEFPIAVSGGRASSFRRRSSGIPAAEDLRFQHPSPRFSRDKEPDEPFQAILLTPRSQSGGGTRTSRSRRLGEFHATGELEMNPADFDRLGLERGSRVRLISSSGVLERAVVPAKRVPAGCVVVPVGVHGNDAMEIVDFSENGWPRRACGVRIEKIQELKG